MKPGPRPRHQQLELLDANEAAGRPPRFWTSVDRVAAKGRREVERVAGELLELGWVLVTNAEGWWTAYSRRRHRTERAYTSAGLLRMVRTAENGGAAGQRELFTPGPPGGCGEPWS